MPFNRENFNGINLPIPTKNINVSITAAINKRKSSRNFIQKEMNLQNFTDILYYSFGAKELNTKQSYVSYNYPSAGGFNSLRIFIIVNNIRSLENGVYEYNPIINAIKLLNNISDDDYKKISGSFSLAINSCFSVHISRRNDLYRV